MTTGALLSQDCSINRHSYTQNVLYYYNVRQLMAFLKWEHGRVRGRHIIRWLTNNLTTATTANITLSPKPSTPP